MAKKKKIGKRQAKVRDLPPRKGTAAGVKGGKYDIKGNKEG